MLYVLLVVVNYLHMKQNLEHSKGTASNYVRIKYLRQINSKKQSKMQLVLYYVSYAYIRSECVCVDDRSMRIRTDCLRTQVH